MEKKTVGVQDICTKLNADNNMRYSKCIIILLIIICTCCTTRTNIHTFQYTGRNNDLINSIIKFKQYSPVYKTDSVFKVVLRDNSETFKIDVYNHFAYIEPFFKDTVGALSTTFPCQVIKIDNKLFCIYAPDEENVIDQKIWDMYKNKGLLDTLWFYHDDYYEPEKSFYRPSDFWEPAIKERYVYKK